jgi:sugar lactone lactonase YvrE
MNDENSGDSTMAAELIWEGPFATGEGPVWDGRNQRLLFSDIPAGQIHALTPATGARQTWQLPEVVGSFGLCVSGRLIVALRHRVVLFNLETSEITDFAGPIDEPETNRLNDGKVAPDGSFWVGSMDQNAARQPIGNLYRVTPDGRMEKKSSGYMVSNGLAWSPDGTIMYHSCSSQGFIDAWDHAAGEISNRRLFAQQTREDGMPDGAATDAEGRYWSAGVTAGCLNIFTPDGHLAEKIALPVASPTMPCFTPHGIYITSLVRADAPKPGMGGLYLIPGSIAGTPMALFDDIGGAALAGDHA